MKKEGLALVALSIIGIALFLLIVASGLYWFLFQLDNVYYIKNDTMQPADLTFLVQNHDNNEYYLQTATVKSGETLEKRMGLEFIKCIAVSSGEDQYTFWTDKRMFSDEPSSSMGEASYTLNEGKDISESTEHPCVIEEGLKTKNW